MNFEQRVLGTTGLVVANNSINVSRAKVKKLLEENGYSCSLKKLHGDFVVLVHEIKQTDVDKIVSLLRKEGRALPDSKGPGQGMLISLLGSTIDIPPSPTKAGSKLVLTFYN